MRYLRYALLAILLIVIVSLSLANSASVTLKLMPPGFDFIYQAEVTLPLFFVIIGAVVIGFICGELLEYVRERKIRRVSSQRRREVMRLERENQELKKKTGEGEDDVLALLN
ncbi:MAG: LapA family protein [Pseudomonadota bacterium]